MRGSMRWRRLRGDTLLTGRLRATLKSVPDLTRAMTRLALDRGGPRDLLAVAQRGARRGGAVARCCGRSRRRRRSSRVLARHPRDGAGAAGRGADPRGRRVAAAARARRRLRRARATTQTLDAERALASETRGVVAALQARLVDETDVKSLRIKHNNQLGYFVEVPARAGHEAARGAARGSASSTARRWPTPCGSRPPSWPSSRARSPGRTRRRWRSSSRSSPSCAPRCWPRPTSSATSPMRSRRSMSPPRSPISPRPATGAGPRSTTRWPSRSRAAATRWSRPPSAPRAASSSPTTRDLTGGALWLVTGPNMGGKSTFLRQNALIAILAQMGSLRAGGVGPYRRRRPRLLPRRRLATTSPAAARPSWSRWSRPPPSSTAPPQRSLVILDEIGRGTATFDGLSIAWAAVEALHNHDRLPGAVRHPFPRDDGARQDAGARRQRHDEGARVGGRGGLPPRSRARARPTAPTASRWRGSPGCPNPCLPGRGKCSQCSNSALPAISAAC